VIALCGIAGGELRYLCPGAAAALKNIGRAGQIIVTIGSHNGIVAQNRHAITEEVVGFAVAGGELRYLCPGAAAALKNIGRAGTCAIVIVTISPNNGIVA